MLDREAARQGSSWDDEENKHYLQGALRMRAANKLYEDKLLQVKELRAQIATLRTAITQGKQGADPAKLEAAGLAALRRALDGPALRQRGLRLRRRDRARRDGHADQEEAAARSAGTTSTAIMPGPGSGTRPSPTTSATCSRTSSTTGRRTASTAADHWYAAFKMGKYADRMVDAIPHLAEGGMITQTQAADAREGRRRRGAADALGQAPRQGEGAGPRRTTPPS